MANFLPTGLQPLTRSCTHDEDYPSIMANAQKCKSCRLKQEMIRTYISPQFEWSCDDTERLDIHILSTAHTESIMQNLVAHTGRLHILPAVHSWGAMRAHAIRTPESSRRMVPGKEIVFSIPPVAVTTRCPQKQRLRLMQSWLKESLSRVPPAESMFASRPATGADLPCPLPKRILDLEPPNHLSKLAGNDRSSCAPLRLLVNEPGATGHYLTLSHRWGESHQMRLTRSSLEEFRACIPFRALPDAYKDAVTLSRQLGYRYLWIDALCIMQDDTKDWLEQAEAMAAVYHNSDCTIAAHASRHDNDGFLSASLLPAPRRHLVSVERSQMNHSFLLLKSNFRLQVNQSFLSQRGWVFQERILSPRVLHFVRYYAFFEDELGIKASDQGSRILGLSQDFSPWSDLKISVQDAVESFAQWYRMIEQYSKCDLTVESDRLPAIAGLANFYGLHSHGDQYLFGIWKQSLHIGLLFMEIGAYPREMTEGHRGGVCPPTWSWARWRSPIRFPDTIVGCTSDIENLSIHAAPQGTLSFQAPLISFTGVTAVRQGSNSYRFRDQETGKAQWAVLDGHREQTVHFPTLSCVLIATHEKHEVYMVDDVIVDRFYYKLYYILLEAE